MHLSKFGIFKTRAPKGFEFNPRYYNERKDRIDKLEKKFRAEKERSKNDSSHSTRLKDEMNAQWGREHVSRQGKFARQRLLIILAVLGLALVYMYFKLDSSF